MSPGRGGPGHALPAASTYAAVKSLSDWAATASARCIDPPLTIPGGNPVNAEPGLIPRFPFTTVAPVLVTVEPARTPKLAADPRLTGNWALMQTENVAYRINAADFLMAFSSLSPRLPNF
jgi:hypothetical protein